MSLVFNSGVGGAICDGCRTMVNRGNVNLRDHLIYITTARRHHRHYCDVKCMDRALQDTSVKKSRALVSWLKSQVKPPVTYKDIGEFVAAALAKRLPPGTWLMIDNDSAHVQVEGQSTIALRYNRGPACLVEEIGKAIGIDVDGV